VEPDSWLTALAALCVPQIRAMRDNTGDDLPA
jgi:hypothetical protein